jgi:hypothetical protein
MKPPPGPQSSVVKDVLCDEMNIGVIIRAANNLRDMIEGLCRCHAWRSGT